MKKLMAILIGFLLAYLLAACGASDNVMATMAAAPPTTIPLVVATPSTVSSTTPTVLASSVLEFPSGGADYAGEEQAPGQYKTPAWFSLPFTFKTTKAFRGIGEQLPKGELFGIAEGRQNLPPRQLLFWAVDPSISVETTISQLRATPNVEVGPNQPVNMGELSGTQFDATTQQDVFIPALGDLVGHQGNDWQPNSSKVHLRFIVLSVAGRTLLIYIEAPKDEFQDFVTEVDQVLGTVKFEVNDSAASSAATNTPTPAATATKALTSTLAVEPTSEPASSPAEFVMQITGDPNPLNWPGGLALDAQGNLYVVDTANYRIQKFDSEGQFLTMWGSQGKGEGQFNFIVTDVGIGDVAVDQQGNVYVSDSGNYRIQKFDSNGQFQATWGSKGEADGQFKRPIILAVDEQGYIYVVDDGRDDIQKFDGEGRFVTKWGGHGSGDGQFGDTGGITVDGQGNVYAADFENPRIQKFDSKGQFLGKWGGAGIGDGQFIQPAGLAVDEQGNIYVAEWGGNERIQKFDSNGQFLAAWGGEGKGDGQFNHPFDVVVDGQGNVYVSDQGNNRVQKFRQK